MKGLPSLCVVACWTLGLGTVLPAVQAEPAPRARTAPAASPRSPIMPIDEVRIGMKGYGLTVFQGTTIEPFPVEIISVMRDFGPKHGVIWILCGDERLRKSGPVSGMSGSPIYLWDKDEPHDPGQGGRLIGAFAYGYSWIKDCYAGVQPIEHMLETAGRAEAAAPPGPSAGAAPPLEVTLRTLLAVARQQGLDPGQTWRAELLAHALSPQAAPSRAGNDGPHHPALPAPPAPPALRDGGGIPTRLMLPMAVPGSGVAQALAPMLAPFGIQPMQAPAGTMAGLPPREIDPEKIRLQPGSVLTIPFAFGDMDLSASGTVTEILEDGRVLAFGHAMFGEGPAAVPMATGFVHFIVPRVSGSFKLSGSAVIRGAIVRDEGSAVVGAPRNAFRTAPARVRVRLPDQPAREYRYQITHHKQLTPTIAAMVTMQSVVADQNLPANNTVRLSGHLLFEGERRVEVDTVLANASPTALAMQLVPPIASLIQNPHDLAMLERLDLTVEVEATPRSAVITSAQLDTAEIAPGERLGINLRLQPYRRPATTKRIVLDIPESLAEGSYRLAILDARRYSALRFKNRPHLMNTASVDDVHDFVRQVMGIANDAAYVVLQLPDGGLAVGREELPQLPSSRRALIATPTSTLATPYLESVEKVVPLGVVPTGQLVFNLQVKHDR